MDLNHSSLFGTIEDLQDLSIVERPVRRSLKTQEEIERLTVDEELSDIERAVYLLSSGQDVQTLSVAINLPKLVQQHASEAIRRVVPKLREVLHVAGVEMQITTSVSFLTIFQEESVSVQAYTCSFLQIILQSLDNKDPGASTAWLETLLLVIDGLPKEIIRQEILNPLVTKAQLCQTVHSRSASCKILGKIATKFEPHVLKKDILPLVKSLCQDVDYEVRSCMCRQLENIAHGTGTEVTKTTVLPELVELFKDESSSVRLAAFETIVNVIELVDRDDKRQIVLPLVKSFCEKSFKTDESVLISLSLHLGKVCHGLSGILTTEQHSWFLALYRKLCILGVQQENGHNEGQIQALFLELEKTCITVRKNCAYNLPALVYFVKQKHFHTELHSTFVCLCHDPEVSVRCTVANGFHEVSKLLGSSVHLINKELIALLQDEAIEVLNALLEHLPEILEVMITGGDCAGSENKLVAVHDLISALITAEQRAAASLKWRIHEKLIRKFSCLPQVLSSDQIYYSFLHRMFTIFMTNHALPVQRAAAHTLCIFLRYNRKQEERHEIINKLIRELGQGKSYWNRLRFLDTCEYVMELFSKSFFCKYFFLPALELANDSVANVRIKLCYLLPKLKSKLKLPSDRHLLQQLELCVRKLLCQEKDKDVMAAIRKIVLELDRMETVIEPFHKRLQEKDIIDQKKEREENLLLEMEQMEKDKQQSEVKSSEKFVDKKRRDSKAGPTMMKHSPSAGSGNPSNTAIGKNAGRLFCCVQFRYSGNMVHSMKY
ncbi:serine/threonine-protein phosphatase 4 regulatory subunit 4 [Protopterus annectens]|uniref:serine/threonine-protein phosphatase 4 regulatory subunit 4 n=1 Tax=Protopterus annectens TaxID=7888 RepID=UPI001CFA3C88|nr:serine/threonine-protein phosphatase 4 regulatory subunit 4 [Protopterus annectens]